MSEDSMEIDRRSVLKYAGVSSAVLGGLSQTVAADRSEGTPSVEPREFRPDISDMPNVEEALIRINEDATVTHRLRTRHPKEETGPSIASHESPTATRYSLDLSPSDLRASSTSVEADKPGDAPLTAQLNKQEKTVSSQRVRAMDSGIPDEPDSSYYDWVAYLNTSSQECGALARTKIERFPWGRSSAERDMVRGDACDGEKWDEKFEAFCSVLDPIPGLTCQVPSAFNTNWYADHTASQDNGGTYEAATLFSCPNFPAIPDTAFSAQYLKVNDGSNARIIESKTNTGVLNGAVPRDISLDMNEILNTITKGVGSALGVATVGYSWALTAYLLDHQADIA